MDVTFVPVLVGDNWSSLYVMWRFLAFMYLSVCTNAQNNRNQRPFDNGHGWDIRLAVPGEPGRDYPVLNSIPRTSFTCSGKEPGYYADVETNCQVFRVCTIGATYGFQSFLCPNGTLFNQAVFVCDWWMQVNCEKTSELINKKNEQFGNLRLGPQFMTDIKKMITHPMRNPYDKAFIKSNLISMQEYRPPPGQLYNGAFLRNSEKSTTSDVFVKTKQSQSNPFHDIYSTADISFAASTPGTHYIQNYNGFQRQIQNIPYSQPNRAERLLYNPVLTSNGHGGQTWQTNNKITTFSPLLNSSQSNSRIQTYHNRDLHNRKQTTFGVEFSKQQLYQRIRQNQQLHSPGPTQTYISNGVVTQGEKETKQNLVSNETKPGLVTKTLAFRRIIKDSKDGTPKSRITFKTWIVRPSKNAKLVADTTPYTYSRPSHIVENLIDKTTSNVNLTPISSTTSPITKNVGELYKYNAPTLLSRQIITPIKEISKSQVSLTTPRLNYVTILPTKSSPTYLVPTTYKPIFTSNIPLVGRARQISRQYLLPKDIENSQIITSGSSPTPLYEVPFQTDRKEPTLIINKQSHINTNHNNVAFSDILTRGKLDITVNDIVQDTNDILKTASPDIIPYEKTIQALENPANNYLPPDSEPESVESDQQSLEKLTLQSKPPLPKSSRLIATLSPNLEPPIETDNTNETYTELSNLQYLNEPTLPPNTIERTVSLKITIPENIAKYLFKKRSDNDLNNLEILNAGNSNYLVLTNDLSDNSDTKFVPIGKLIRNNISNISDSQDLVFSLLADSINIAKAYNSVAQQNLVTSTPHSSQSQLQNIVQGGLGSISKDITRLTLPKYSGSNFSVYHRPTKSPQPEQNLPKRYKENSNYFNNYTQNQYFTSQTTQQNIGLSEKSQKQIKSSENMKSSTPNILTNYDKIYSGQLYQLPVPDVTRHIYNSPNPSISNFILSNSFLPTNSPSQESHTEFEIIPSQSVPVDSLQSLTEEKDVTPIQGSSVNIFVDDFQNPSNGITAQVHDNIIGTLPHPLDNKKQIKYKKDQSYYYYSHFNHNNDNSLDIESNENKLFLHNTSPSPPSSFQVLPSVGYKLEDEKERENFLNVFQINEFGSPRQNNPNENINLNRRQDIRADVDFTVTHPTSSNKNKLQRLNHLNTLYDRPTSYSAPQRSVGSLDKKRNKVKDSSYKANLEKFDTYDKGYGYPKPINPVKRFLF